MRLKRRFTTLLAGFGCVAAITGFPPAALAAPVAASAGTECVEYNGKVVYCIDYP